MVQMTAQSPASDITTSSTASVLVVEDDEAMRDLLRRMLERKGFAVETAPNGSEALKLFRERPVDVVITDMIMPEMSGFDLIRTMIADRPSVRMIAISGVEDRIAYLKMATRLGAKAALQKPVEAAQLVETVRRVLAA